MLICTASLNGDGMSQCIYTVGIEMIRFMPFFSAQIPGLQDKLGKEAKDDDAQQSGFEFLTNWSEAQS